MAHDNDIAVECFDNWFSGSYQRLHDDLSVQTVDNDAFHDTYIRLRDSISREGKDIDDYTSYFVTCYKRARLKSFSSEGRFSRPGDPYFLNTPHEDESREVSDQRDAYSLAHDILAHVRSNFSRQDYRLFCLKTAFPGYSYRDLSLYTGINPEALRKRVNRIKEAVTREENFVTRRKQLII